MNAAVDRRTYRRLRELASEPGARPVADAIGIPRPMVASWKRRGCREVVILGLAIKLGDELVAFARAIAAPPSRTARPVRPPIAGRSHSTLRAVQLLHQP